MEILSFWKSENFSPVGSEQSIQAEAGGSRHVLLASLAELTSVHVRLGVIIHTLLTGTGIQI